MLDYFVCTVQATPDVFNPSSPIATFLGVRAGGRGGGGVGLKKIQAAIGWQGTTHLTSGDHISDRLTVRQWFPT